MDGPMWESVLTVLAMAVFACLWLASQDWFDLLPRRYARGLSAFFLILFGFSCYAAPSAFQAGFKRWTDHAAAKATQQAQDMLKTAIGRAFPMPSPTPTPRPTPTSLRVPSPRP